MSSRIPGSSVEAILVYTQVLKEASHANGEQQTLTLLQSAPSIDLSEGQTGESEGVADEVDVLDAIEEISLIDKVLSETQVFVEPSHVNERQQTLMSSQSAPSIDFAKGQTSVAEGRAELDVDEVLIDDATTLPLVKEREAVAETEVKVLVRSVLVSRAVEHAQQVIVEVMMVRSHSGQSLSRRGQSLFPAFSAMLALNNGSQIIISAICYTK